MLISMIKVNKDRNCYFEPMDLEHAKTISRIVIKASIEIARDDPDLNDKFGADVRDVYAVHLPDTIQGRWVGQYLQVVLDKKYPPEPGRERGIICDGDVCRLDDR